MPWSTRRSTRSDRPRRGGRVLQPFDSQPARSRAADGGAAPCAAVDRRPREVHRQRPLRRQAGAGGARRARPGAVEHRPGDALPRLRRDGDDLDGAGRQRDDRSPARTAGRARRRRRRPGRGRHRTAAGPLPGPCRARAAGSGRSRAADPRRSRHLDPPGTHVVGASSASTWPATCCCPDRTRASPPRRSTTGSPARRRETREQTRVPRARRTDETSRLGGVIRTAARSYERAA